MLRLGGKCEVSVSPGFKFVGFQVERKEDVDSPVCSTDIKISSEHENVPNRRKPSSWYGTNKTR
jgi:hypothetical protein